METDRLIETLAADNGYRTRPIGVVLALALLAAAPVTLVMFFAVLGVRPDAMEAMHNPFFDLKFVVTLALAISAIIISLHLTRPEASLRGWGWLLLIPVGLLVVAIAVDATQPHSVPWLMRLVGSNYRVCLTAIPAMSMPLLVAALLVLRRGAPSQPEAAGAVAGLASAGLAGTLYASHCTDDSPMFVLIWYTLAAGIVGAIGAVIGARVLRY